MSGGMKPSVVHRNLLDTLETAPNGGFQGFSISLSDISDYWLKRKPRPTLLKFSRTVDRAFLPMSDLGFRPLSSSFCYHWTLFVVISTQLLVTAVEYMLFLRGKFIVFESTGT